MTELTSQSDEQPRSRGRTNRILRAVAASIVLLGVIVSLTARHVVAWQLSVQTGLNATVEQVRIWPGWVTVSGVRLFGTNEADTLLTIQSIESDYELWDGLCHGKWVRNLTIIQPSVGLEFDAKGRVTTALPVIPSSESSEPPVIPLRRLVAKDCQLHLRQQQLTFDVTGVAISVDCDDHVQVRLKVPDLLRSRIVATADIDLTTMATSDARLNLSDLNLTRQQLLQLPLVAKAVAAIPDFRTAVSLHCRYAGSLQSPTIDGLTSSIRGQMSGLRLSEFPSLSSVICQPHEAAPIGVKVSVQQTGPRTDITTDSTLLGGTLHTDSEIRVELSSAFDLCSATSTTTWKAAGFDPQPFAQIIPIALQARLGSSGEATLTLDDKRVRLAARAKATVDALQIAHTDIAPVVLHAQANAATSLENPAGPELNGFADFDVQSDGVSLANVAAGLNRLLPELGISTADSLRVAKTLNTVRPNGHVAFSAAGRVPLSTVIQANDVTLAATVTGRNLSTTQFRISDVDATLNWQHGIGHLTVPDVQITDVGTQQSAVIACSVAVPNPTSDLDATAEFRMTQFPLSLPGQLAGLQPDELSGDVSAGGQIRVPVNQLQNPAAYIGGGSVDFPLIRFRSENIEDGKLTWTLDQRGLAIDSIGCRLESASVAARAAIQTSTPYRCQASFVTKVPDLRETTAAVGRMFAPLPEVAGAVNVTGNLAGDLAEQRFTADGF